MKIGFAKINISPPVGMELAGYAGYRPCAGVHDPLWCKAVVLEQEGMRYALVVLDLMCVDEPLYHQIAQTLAPLGISREKLIVSAIHSHAAPQGMLPGEGILAGINNPCHPEDPAIKAYMKLVIEAALEACTCAVADLESFQIRVAKAAVPPVGSERHTGTPVDGEMVVLQCRTQSGRILTIYNFPCHPTVLSAENLLASADFVGRIEGMLGGEMTVFLNGAAGDISTRFTRRESTFEECDRKARIAAEAVQMAIESAHWEAPLPLQGIHTTVILQARETEPLDQAEEKLTRATARWQQAMDRGEDPAQVRLLKTYVEGAWVNREFARALGNVRQLRLPVTVFRFCGVDFVAIPGELFSALKPEGLAVIGYANGYFRYIAGKAAYDAGCYEALAAILARGEGERLMDVVMDLVAALHDGKNK